MTIKKRLLISNILMIVVPVMAALAAGACCIALLWLMLQNGGGLPLEDSGDFSWASRAVVKLVSRSLEEGRSLDTLGEIFQAHGLRVTVCSGVWRQVPEWAEPALGWAVQTGLFRGRSGNLLAPKDETSRAEGPVCFQRLQFLSV